MKLSVLASGTGACSRVGGIRGIAFDKTRSWVKCVLTPVLTAGFAASQDSCAQFGCLFPHGSRVCSQDQRALFYRAGCLLPRECLA